jgi:hypothetical protein
MKNIKYIIAGLLAFILLGYLAFEFYVWRSHGYSPYYHQIQNCIDQGGAWNKEKKTYLWQK